MVHREAGSWLSPAVRALVAAESFCAGASSFASLSLSRRVACDAQLGSEVDDPKQDRPIVTPFA